MAEETLKTPTPKCRLYWSSCWGWRSKFVGSESGQKQSVKLLQNMVYNTVNTPPPPYSPTATHCLHILYNVHLVWEGGRGGGQREGIRGNSTQAQFLRPGGNSSQAGSKTPTMSECISSLQNLSNTMPQSLLIGIFYRKADIQGLVSLQFIRPWLQDTAVLPGLANPQMVGGERASVYVTSLTIMGGGGEEGHTLHISIYARPIQPTH